MLYSSFLNVSVLMSPVRYGFLRIPTPHHRHLDFGTPISHDVQPLPYEDFLRRRAVAQPLGKILVVEDTVSARLPSWVLNHLSDMLNFFFTHISILSRISTPHLTTRLQTAVMKHDPSLVSLLSHLLYIVDIANYSFSTVAFYMCVTTFSQS